MELALTHRSAGSPHNERLEFLGDALLGAFIAQELYRRQPMASEGELTRWRAHLVRAETLAELAMEQGLGEHLRMGPGELKAAGWRRHSMLADALEAVIGAIYEDGGNAAVHTALATLYAPRWDTLPSADALKDAKTRLQEWLQARSLARPEYSVIDESGPAHKRSYTVRVQVALQTGQPVIQEQALARSRRAAEQKAAEKILAQLKESQA